MTMITYISLMYSHFIIHTRKLDWKFRMPTKKIPKELLRVGMYVVALDTPWLDSPFLVHRFKLKAKKDVLKIKEKCQRYVTIDTDKGLDVLKEVKDVAIKIAPKEKVPKKNGSKEIDFNLSMASELIVAKKLQNEAVAVLQQITQAVQENKTIPTHNVETLIEKTVQSLLRNDQALLTLIHFERHQNDLFLHIFSVFNLSLALAINLNCSEEEQTSLGMAALLHDIGWSKLPLNLLNVNQPYSTHELNVVKKHPDLSLEIAKGNPDINTLSRQIIIEHHERGDGSGYPNGLCFPKIHRLSRIIGIVDSYDQMTNSMTDSPGIVPWKALQNLYKASKLNAYDQNICEAFITLLGIYPISTAVQLNTGEKGIVVEVNHQKPQLPVLKLYYNKQGNPLLKPIEVDTSCQKEKIIRTIIKVIDPDLKRNDPAKLLHLQINAFSREDR